jgi:hypothetical protein
MNSPASFPSPEEELGFHLRLCDLDPVATADVCGAYHDPLVFWLEAAFPNVDPHLRQEAVHLALMEYVKQPHRYDPRRGRLALYLRMAARADLSNLLRREQRHHRQRVPWSVVENDPEGGNILGREEEPLVALEREEEASARQTFLESVSERFTPGEKRVLELMLAGERNNSVFAEALGIADWPPEERDREVKKVKDRIKKRLERGGPGHD